MTAIDWSHTRSYGTHGRHANIAPDRLGTLGKAAGQGLPYLILDGTLISSDRCADKKASRQGKDIDKWYSGKAHENAGNVQALAAPGGVPLWVPGVLPGSTHDITAARELVLPEARPYLGKLPFLGGPSCSSRPTTARSAPSWSGPTPSSGPSVPMSRDKSGQRWRRCPAWPSGCGPARRAGRIAGTGDLPNFFRTPYGPGWALVGDAGYHRDPLTAQGISDAFRDAHLLSEAIDAGLAGRLPLAETLAGYQRQRDEAATAMYQLTCQRATLEPPAPQMSQLLAALRGNQHDTDRLIGVLVGTVPIPEFFAPGNIQRITGAASTPA